MTAVEPIILTAYLLCIAYFLSQIINSLNDEFAVHLDAAALKEQLTKYDLQDKIKISASFNKRYELDKLKQLSISVENKSGEDTIYVDWDQSTVTDLSGRSRRVVRLIPGTALDPSHNQVSSPISPKTTLKESLTAEDAISRKDSKGPVALAAEVTQPLIILNKLDKKKQARFIQRRIDLEFFLELACRVVVPSKTPQPPSNDRIRIPCKFVVKKLPWTSGLPWNPKE
jgi:hypothetical protein